MESLKRFFRGIYNFAVQDDSDSGDQSEHSVDKECDDSNCSLCQALSKEEEAKFTHTEKRASMQSVMSRKKPTNPLYEVAVGKFTGLRIEGGDKENEAPNRSFTSVRTFQQGKSCLEERKL